MGLTRSPVCSRIPSPFLLYFLLFLLLAYKHFQPFFLLTGFRLGSCGSQSFPLDWFDFSFCGILWQDWRDDGWLPTFTRSYWIWLEIFLLCDDTGERDDDPGSCLRDAESQKPVRVIKVTFVPVKISRVE